MSGLKMLAFAVPGGRRAATDARARVLEEDGLVPDTVRNDLLLLLTELVTNAVRHGGAASGTPIAITVSYAGQRMRVTVTDHGPAFEWTGRSRDRADDGGGYGLVLVDTLSRAWGIHGRGPTTVWFELDASAEPSGGKTWRSWVFGPIARHVRRRHRDQRDGSPTSSGRQPREANPDPRRR